MYLSRDNSGGSATAAQAPGDGGHLLGAVAIAITVSRELWRQMHDIIAPELVISGVCEREWWEAPYIVHEVGSHQLFTWKYP